MSIKVDLSPDVVDKLKNALEDKAFADLLNSMQTAEEIQNALKEKNVDLTIDEIKGIGEAIRAENSEGELDERELEDVSGGSKKGYDFWFRIGQALDKFTAYSIAYHHPHNYRK